MNTVTEPRMTTLFSQLGLEDSPEGIKNFIATHQLPAEVKLTEAPYWSEAQRQLLKELLEEDSEWALVVDQLNEALHKGDMGFLEGLSIF
ncbi:hypothetical protein AKN87_02400 [Thiopseudomonas alkaliphila]|uniref:DUF2789 domain-containing protein n=1 Tax=Thiopseudomonas alkaliphila TaxID=1697053 RepID=A0A0K1XB47_9GAMM|nr:DUF2789 domain-containing protein [Thiopseudomonas alkaliphila]AKX44082.1 hypothetical protein AKN87_02400 [Thiopseudomonas alkaliphila]AKX46319.1 hypothetical protein AKN94_02265 [Thiopseudomonas alkaliphila]AKX49388.1 hypothetical protein AKN93_08245 [Thiopseudomonas alkaliphila]AKX50141.1 hypothetical protein AKN92_00495 [Thiopseudomonas alkaliphila]AKX52702.1 hypothetical protein AKN91_02720 [Thiopseudomonas alkaliphila]